MTHEVDKAGQRNAVAAGFLGWMLDAFDVLLYSLVLRAMIAELGLSLTMAGFLGALTLASSGLGGIVFGVIADRYGRRRAMMLSILTYSIFTGAQGLISSVWQLALCRIIIGLGMGGEWTSGGAPEKSRRRFSFLIFNCVELENAWPESQQQVHARLLKFEQDITRHRRALRMRDHRDSNASLLSQPLHGVARRRCKGRALNRIVQQDIAVADDDGYRTQKIVDEFSDATDWRQGHQGRRCPSQHQKARQAQPRQ